MMLVYTQESRRGWDPDDVLQGAVHSESSEEVVSYSTTYSMSRAASARDAASTAERLSWKISSSADAIDGEDGASIRDRDESKEPSSESGLDGTVVAGALSLGCVCAPAEGAGGTMTEDAASDSSLLGSSLWSISATTILPGAVSTRTVTAAGATHSTQMLLPKNSLPSWRRQ